MNKAIRLTDADGKTAKFKPYQIGNLPKSFDKNKDKYFNKAGITYIEEKEAHWSSFL